MLMLIGLFYRVYGLTDNHFFWTDEEHVAIFARVILERGRPVLANGYSTGIYQWFQYWLSAISAKIFGLNEFAIRFPSVIFGVLTIWAVYLLGKELLLTSEVSPCQRRGPSTSEVFIPLVAALLTTFLKIEILWSRQARPYQALQFFYLLGAYFVCRLVRSQKRDAWGLWGILGSGVLGSLVHPLGLVLLVANWNDLPIWFLGEGKLDYFLRKPIGRKTEKDPVSSARLVYSLEELQEIIENNQQGILAIDSWDDIIPEGIREYSRQHLKRKLEVDRLYLVQPRLWLVNVYS